MTERTFCGIPEREAVAILSEIVNLRESDRYERFLIELYASRAERRVSECEAALEVAKSDLIKARALL